VLPATRIEERSHLGDNSCFGITFVPSRRSWAITKRIGWHTFRRTYSTLLRATGAELKVIQLMRHSTIRVTLDTYTQAVTTEKRAAQTAVVSLLVNKKERRAA